MLRRGDHKGHNPEKVLCSVPCEGACNLGTEHVRRAGQKQVDYFGQDIEGARITNAKTVLG
jgi:hypothetical protein